MKRELADSLFIRAMKDYRKMSRGELLAWVEKLKARYLSRERMRRARAASALRDREARLRAILETAVEGIITINDRGVIESFNAAAEKTFGYRAREVIGRNVSLLMPSPDRDRHDTYLRNYLQTGQAKIIGIGREVAGRRKDGTVFPMDLAVSEVRLADRRLFTGFVRDITERKRLEKEILAASEREQRRIGYDLHDGLCQQLAAVELMSQVLEQKLAPRSKNGAARAGEIATHVREAIAHTRSLARGLSPVLAEAEGLMSGLEELAANTERFFKTTCRFDCYPPVRVYDHVTATHLFRIAQEAVSNAIKHGRARRIWISLESSGDRVLLRISNHGRQFPTKTARSNGMGLRIMQSRAGMIGGSLALERDDGGVSVICSAPNPLPGRRKPYHGRQT